MNTPHTIAESKNFIVLDRYDPIEQSGSYQTEQQLEQELIDDLNHQGYIYRRDLRNNKDLLDNIRDKIEQLNNITFNNDEWQRFVLEYLDKPSDNQKDKARKVHCDDRYDFIFDDGHIKNIYLFDKKQLGRNQLEVINQFEQTDLYTNRYDVTLLINGIPLIHIELKKRGIAIREAFNQVHRYSIESFNSESSLFKFLQIFIISNGTDTRYFANTTARNASSFDFTMSWAKKDNSVIADLKDFTATFLQKNTLLNILFRYSVLDINNNLLIMRPYQIAASERILWKITASYQSNTWSCPHGGGYIWHTTGSGKTLTSFKAARLATELNFIDKVFFVVDRKDLDYQTMKEYQKFSPDSVNGSENTTALKRNIEKNDNKIIVTTIQKLNKLISLEKDLPIYKKKVVFIFDECHRSQFGKVQQNIQKAFKYYLQFGFTGTPIFPENSLGEKTTESVFGALLHSYLITDAIRDQKVLKFKIDYNDVRPQFRTIENEQSEEKLNSDELKKLFNHPDRIKEICQYILKNFNHKTHRFAGNKNFNAMLAVANIEAAKIYYQCFQKLQQAVANPLKIATIFSFAANEESGGEIADESFETSYLQSNNKEFLSTVVDEYNHTFATNFSLDRKGFENYYQDIAKRVKNKDIDLLIVVGMFLTGFDAKTLNTLFVDKNLRYHGLIQAYSRTNRILDATKSFGNIVTFRNLEKTTNEAISLFGQEKSDRIIIEKPFKDYFYGTSEMRGYLGAVSELQKRFTNPSALKGESEEMQKEFIQLFGECLRLENKLRNYDEFHALKALQSIENEEQKRHIQQSYGINDETLEQLAHITLVSDRLWQDYRSAYNDIRELRWQSTMASKVDWSDVTFEIELLKSQEINLDYILELIFEQGKKTADKEVLMQEITRIIGASMGHRAKESLIREFIAQEDFELITDKASMIERFHSFADIKQEIEIKQLIEQQNLDETHAKRFIETSLKRGYASEQGDDIKNMMKEKISPLHQAYRTKKQSIFSHIKHLIEKFRRN